MAFTTVQDYLDLLSSQHQDQPLYAAFLTVFLQGQVDLINLLSTMPGLFDVDIAEGVQLDAVGVRVGQSRQIPVPLTGVYFAWDTDWVGWDQGAWQGPWDPDFGMTQLSDEAYRGVLRAIIASNQWDGTAPGAYDVWAMAFGDGQIQLRDNQDMSIDITWVGRQPDAVNTQLLSSGRLLLKPAGVTVNNLWEISPTGERRRIEYKGNWTR
jgi:Protein of unknown function (DUF2612)